MASINAGTRKKIAEAWVEIKPSMNGFFTAMNSQMNSQMRLMNKAFNSSFSGFGSSSSKAFSRSFTSGTSGLSKALKSPFSGLSSIARNAGKLAGSAFSSALSTATTGLKIGTGIGLAAGGLAVGKVATSGLSRALNIEDAQAKLQALKFTSEQIKTIGENAMASVKGTSFAFDQAMKTSVSGLAAGIKEGAQLENYLKLIADSSTVAGTDLDEMGYIFNKITANTRAYSEELNMLADRGIPIYSWLAKEMKVSQSDLRGLIKDGEISAAQFLTTMEKNLGGAATTATSTTRGYVANFNAALSRLGAGLLGGSLPIFTEMLKELIPVVDAFTTVSKESGDSFWERFGKNVLPPFKEFTSTLTQNIEAGRPLFPFFDKIKEGVGSVKDLVTGLKEGFQTLQDWGRAIKDSPFGQMMTGWAEQVVNFVSHLRPLGEIWEEFIMPAVMPFFNLFMQAIPMFQGLANGIIAIVIPLRDLITNMVLEIVSALTGSDGSGFSAIGGFFAGLGEMIGTFIKDYGPLVIELVKVIGTGIAQVFAEVFPQVINVVKSLVGALGEIVPVIMDVIPLLVPVITEVATILADVFGYLGSILGRILPDLIMGLGPILMIVVEVVKYLLIGAGMIIEGVIMQIDIIYNALATVLNALFKVINAFGGNLQLVDLNEIKFNTGVFEIGSGNYETNMISPYGMATGGTVDPRVGGTTVRLAEAGRPESVVDTGLMNKNLAYQNQLLQNGNGNQPIYMPITINTTGDINEEKLAKMIDKQFRRKISY